MFSRAYIDALRGVHELEDTDVRRLESVLQADPGNYEARLKLIAYHTRGDRINRADSRQAHLQHVMWLIENKSDSDILASPHAQLDTPEARQAEPTWITAIQRKSGSSAVLWNAVCFYRNYDKEKYRGYLQKVVAMEPSNIRYGHELGLVYAEEIITGAPTGAKAQLDREMNVFVLESAIRLLHSPKFEPLAQTYFRRAQQLDPAIDKASVLPDLTAQAAAPLPPPDPARVHRLQPKDFPELPARIRQYMDKRGCSIPQPSREGRVRNVIKGEFFAKGETAWSALCSAKGESAILVFRHSEDTHPEELATARDEIYIGTDGKQTYYWREIQPVDRRYIIGHYRVYGGPEPPPIDHQGIDDAFLEKASITHYRYRGKWLQLQGAD